MKKILLVLILAAFVANAAEVVGTLNITRSVKVSSAPITDGANISWLDAKNNQAVTNLQGIRTLKRSMAEINFNDKSILRINERTDLVIQESREMRNINLKEGAVWIQVAKGSKTTVHTPTTTATARGTIFIVTVNAQGDTTVTVLEGTVDVQSNDDLNNNIPPTAVTAGESVNIIVVSIPDGLTLNDAKVSMFKSEIPIALMPVELGGTANGWTSALTAVANGTMVT